MLPFGVLNDVQDPCDLGPVVDHSFAYNGQQWHRCYVTLLCHAVMSRVSTGGDHSMLPNSSKGVTSDGSRLIAKKKRGRCGLAVDILSRYLNDFTAGDRAHGTPRCHVNRFIDEVYATVGE